MKPNLHVDFAGISMKNPVLPASGCFGFGKEYSNYFDLNLLGGIITKAITKNPRLGNPTPRVTETTGGMLNSIGLANPGLELVIKKDLVYLENFDVPVIANVAGDTISDYCEVARILTESSKVQGLELNVSCPNVKTGGLAFGVEEKVLGELIREVRKVTSLPLIVKLSPNVTDIATLAKTAEDSGADALSLINTLLGMSINVHTRRPVLARKMGGFSGPGIKPVALRAVYQVAQAVRIPLMGLGGIFSGEDALEFIMAGASCVAVGTANFTDPQAMPRIICEMYSFMEKEGIQDLKEIRGSAHC